MANKLGMIVGGFIVILFGIVLLGAIADSIYDTVTLSTATNETVAIVNQGGETANADVVSTSFFGNATNNTFLTQVTLGEEVNVTSNGSITLSSAEFPADGDYSISYSYEGANYVANSTSRTILRLITIFFAIAVMASGAMLVVVGFREIL